MNTDRFGGESKFRSREKMVSEMMVKTEWAVECGQARGGEWKEGGVGGGGKMVRGKMEGSLEGRQAKRRMWKKSGVGGCEIIVGENVEGRFEDRQASMRK